MSVTAPRGFVASGVACGLKADGALDLALVATESGRPVPAAAVFTSNLAPAAPVTVSRAHLAASSGLVGAVVLNSGGANAGTGRPGLEAAEATCAALADSLGLGVEEVLVCSTGVIGTRLHVGRIKAGIAALVAARGSGPSCAAAAANAILTTDTRPKQVVVEGPGFTVGAMAKGAAMLAPNLATMLCVATTDARASSQELSGALRAAVARSFNELTVDGCESTNDTVVVLSSGEGPEVNAGELTEVLSEATDFLARQMAGDAEGGTKTVQVTVIGATDDMAARVAARHVAESNLVKCSWYGEDANWGRILAALGSAGVPLEGDRISIAYGGVTVCRDGMAVAHDESTLSSLLATRVLEISCDLGIGPGTGRAISSDLTHGYVEENRGRS